MRVLKSSLEEGRGELLPHALVSWEQERVQTSQRGPSTPNFRAWCRHQPLLPMPVPGWCVTGKVHGAPALLERWTPAKTAWRRFLAVPSSSRHHLFIPHGKYFSNND